LVDQVADSTGEDKDAVSCDSKEDHDNDQRNKHKVFADVALHDIQQALRQVCLI
jgi:hypothetical protein